MKPSKEQLMDVGGIEEVAKLFSVSTRTARRWLTREGLFQPKANYRPNKLNAAAVAKIRKEFEEGKSIKALAEEHHVTFASVSRVVRNMTHRVAHDTAAVFVIYHPR